MTDKPISQDLRYGSEAYRKIVMKPGGLLYTAYINRNLAWFFTRLLNKYSPNQVSIGAFLILFLALPLAFVSNSMLVSSVAYVLLALNYVLDSSDGQIARLTGRGGPLGEWVDHSLDGMRLLLVHLTLLLVTIPSTNSGWLQFAICLNIVCAPGLFFATELAGKILPHKVDANISSSKSLSWWGRSVLLLPADHGIFILLFLLAHQSNVLAPIYGLYGLYFCAMLSAFSWATFRANDK